MKTKILATALVAAGAGFARKRHFEKVDAVAPSLRHPLLYMPVSGLAKISSLLPAPQRNWMPVAPAAAGVRVQEVTPDYLGHTAPTGFLNIPEHITGDGAVLWIHGGGHVIATAGANQAYPSKLAQELGVPVFSPEYRNAGEAPFPADLEDVYTALHWFQENAEHYGINPAKIAVSGSSAGGGLAAAVVNKAFDEGHPVNFQALIYPMLDDRAVLRKDDEGRGNFVWTRTDNEYAWRTYLNREPGGPGIHEYAAPARRENLAGLPATWIGVGELDLFYEEDLAYAQRLKEAGVNVQTHVEPGMYHGADVLVPRATSTQSFNASLLKALRDFFVESSE